MNTMNVISVVVSLLIFQHASATLTPISDPGSKTLLQYGYGSMEQNFIMRTKSPVISSSSSIETKQSDIITSHEVNVESISDYDYNVTSHMFFEGFPGKAKYRLVLKTLNEDGLVEEHKFEDEHEVYGATFYEDDGSKPIILSGDHRNGISLPELSRAAKDSRMLKVRVYPESANFSNAVVRVSHSMADHKTILGEEDVLLHASGMTIRPADHRSGAGRAFVHVEMPDISVDGESFETVTVVKVGS